MLQNGDFPPYEGGSPSQMFHGVRFLLLGFNPVEETMIRSKLVDGGGLSVDEYGSSCTHVIVDKIVYDDSRCIAARSDGKTVVTALWVDHSFDIGMPVDASGVLYRPVKDLNGIPGAKSFCICLTGYLRQDREDIMRMVGLMGAHFSKPLVANKVTHLICYKFEGEKYELAKKMKRIKLINHRWLEDCLKAWEILPEDDYDKSGHEIEIMEAEAKDSEDETEDRNTKQTGVGSVAESPKRQSGQGASSSKVSEIPMTRQVSKVRNAAADKGLIVTEDAVSEKRLSINGENRRSDNTPALYDVNKDDFQNCVDTGAYCAKDISVGELVASEKTLNSTDCDKCPTDQVNSKRSFHSDTFDASTSSYSRKRLKISPARMRSPEGHPEEQKNNSLPSKSIQAKTRDFCHLQNLMTDPESNGAQMKDGILPQKRAVTLSGSSSRSLKRGSPTSINYGPGCTSTNGRSDNTPALYDVNKDDFQNCVDTGAYCGKAISVGVFVSSEKTLNSTNCDEFPTDLFNGKRSFHSDASNASTLSYSRKMSKISPVPMRSPEGHPEEQKNNNLPSKSIQIKTRDFCHVQNLMTDPESNGAQVKDGILPQKRALTLSGFSSGSPKRGSPNSINYDAGCTSTNAKAEGDVISALWMKTPPALTRLNAVEDQSAKLSKSHPSNVKMKPLKCGLPVSKTMISDNDGSPSGVKMLDTKTITPETPWNEPGQTNLAAASDVEEFRLKGPIDQDGFSNTRNSVPERPRSTATLGMHDVHKDRTSSRSGSKKCMDSGSKLGSRSTKDQKLSLNCADSITSKATFSFDEGKLESLLCAETEVVGPTLKTEIFTEQKAQGNPILTTAVENKFVSMDIKTEAPQKESIEKSVNEEVAEFTWKEDIDIVTNLEGIHHLENETKRESVHIGDETIFSEEDGAYQGNTTSAQKIEVERLSCKAVQVAGINEGKCPSSITKKKSHSTKKGAKKSMKDKEVEVEKKISDEKLELAKTDILHTGKPKETVSSEEADKPMNVEENKKPVKNGDPSVNLGKYFRKKVPVKKHRRGMQNTNVAGGTVPDGMLVNGGKCPSNESEKNGQSVVKEIETRQEDKKVEIKKKIGDEKVRMEKGKGLLQASKINSKTVSLDKPENPTDANKENTPITNGCPGVISGKQRKNKVSVKPKRTPMQINTVADYKGMQVGKNLGCVRSEPVWFILSGHRLQRKEFQQAIRRLNGKFCRDSHHWSYQATHFVVPDPLRRTEKFFAAAASGRWILKTDYLTASSQAGKFLTEEPYEWFKNGLSEDGSINLEAPRKWRQLREKTGHGAFYGMCIIIYGECIAPSLDTLKRVVKAGDGTILATSPPYTRFLKSGIDFVIVSPGMPRVDLWVQEFLRNEIPCIMADYLVEYVCKPGFSLDKHVLYSTNAWAEKSFANLLSRSNEIVEDSTLSDEDDRVDLICQVCGSRDRGDVMLICGDEEGFTGCGIGTHIDCCDPPLEAVPEEDWFCPKCSKG